MSCCRQQVRIAGAFECEKLFLSSGPFGYQDIGQRRIGFEYIAWSMGIDSLHEAGSTRLNDRDIPLVEC
ncbi:hypothetical protein D3C80_2186710 [compost metagenome]